MGMGYFRIFYVALAYFRCVVVSSSFRNHLKFPNFEFMVIIPFIYGLYLR